jgi:hypothetical protein
MACLLPDFSFFFQGQVVVVVDAIAFLAAVLGA